MVYIPADRGARVFPDGAVLRHKESREAKAYLADPYLAENMRIICNALLTIREDDPAVVFGYPDDLKLRSSMTLFAEAAPDEKVFQKVLDKFYGGKKDERTLTILKELEK